MFVKRNQPSSLPQKQVYLPKSRANISRGLVQYNSTRESRSTDGRGKPGCTVGQCNCNLRGLVCFITQVLRVQCCCRAVHLLLKTSEQANIGSTLRVYQKTSFVSELLLLKTYLSLLLTAKISQKSAKF